MTSVDLAKDDELLEEDAERVRMGVREHSASVIGEAGFHPLRAFARDPDGRMVGGLVAGTYWGWLHVDSLWVEEARRREGLGTRLLRAAEEEALRRGCRGAYLDTFSFQARPLYERLGYRVVGEVADFPRGHARYFMEKRLGEGD